MQHQNILSLRLVAENKELSEYLSCEALFVGILLA